MLMHLADTTGVDNLVAELVRMANTFSIKSAEHIKTSYQNNLVDSLSWFTTKNSAIFGNSKANQ